MPEILGTARRSGTARALGRRAAIGTAAVSMAVVGMPPLAQAAPPANTPYLSEFHYDNDGGDVGEFVEVHLPPGTSSADLSVVLYNGSNGQTYDTDALPSVTAVDEAAVAVVDYAPNGIQNGAPDALALVRGSGPSAVVLEFLSYEGTLTATNGPAAGLTSEDIGQQESGSEPAGLSLSRFHRILSL